MINIVAVPLASEEAFKPIEDNMDFLKGTNYFDRHYTKHISDIKEADQFFDNIIKPIQNLRTEYYITLDCPPKPSTQNISDYLTNYIKTRNLNSYYTFHEWYNVVINIPNFYEDWYIVPLYIRLKNNKSFDQMRVLRYTNDSPDGFVVEPVNKKHFIKDPSEEDIEPIERLNDDAAIRDLVLGNE